MGRGRADPDSVAIAVKALGDHTSRFGEIRPGDPVRINGGFGNFRPSRSGPVYMIGSGIGIVPILSILKSMARSGDEREVEAFLAVATRDELLEEQAIDVATRAMPGLRVHLLIHDEDGLLYSRDYFSSTLSGPGRYHYLRCSSRNVRSSPTRRPFTPVSGRCRIDANRYETAS